MRKSLLLLLALASTYSAVARGALAYDEAVSVDLSGDGFAPTAFALHPGINTLKGRTGGGDLDYAALTVPTGYRLDALFVRSGTSAAGSGSFIGVQAGTQVTVPSSPADATGLLGWYLYSAANIGANILPMMGVPKQNSTGFTPPLAEGSYAFWIQELGAQSPYNFEFQVAAVPEPASMVLLLAGLGVLAAAVRRRGARA